MKSFNLKIIKNECISLVTLIVIFLTIVEGADATAEEPPAFFLKIAKTIPRIGRSDQYLNTYSRNSDEMNDDLLDKDANQFHKLSKRKYEFSSESDTRTWQHFPLAIEGPPELWRSLAGYTHDPLYSSTNENFNSRIWSRDKRMNNLDMQE